LSQNIDPQIAAKIDEFVKEGITSVREMKTNLRLTVADIFGKQNLKSWLY